MIGLLFAGRAIRTIEDQMRSLSGMNRRFPKFGCLMRSRTQICQTAAEREDQLYVPIEIPTTQIVYSSKASSAEMFGVEVSCAGDKSTAHADPDDLSIFLHFCIRREFRELQFRPGTWAPIAGCPACTRPYLATGWAFPAAALFAFAAAAAACAGPSDAITVSRLKEAAFWRGGNLTKFATWPATIAWAA